MKTISLTQNQVALIDDGDHSLVSRFKWYAEKTKSGGWYAARTVRTNGRKITIRLHNFLMPEASEVDHKNGNGLDNQRQNLRAVTHKQNLQGFQRKRRGASSQYRGVAWDKAHDCWKAQIGVNYKMFYLGLFSTEVEAAKAYDVSAQKHFGCSFNFS